MQETDLHYPADACPFCGIAAAYPDPGAKPALWSAKRRDADNGNGHLLVTTRNHKVKVADMEALESREIGFWLPLLARTVAKATGVTDYNIVQNNGARAAQVVPHVHFHIIPRPASMPEIKSKSWTMFGRGQRDDLDDDEGARMAGEMRRVLRGEIGRLGTSASKL
ncbi:hypothetical protein N0V94_006270 [Neodidymelliopsis sp. IMI 364377]|nr:hypothetical protein N0V94_006270 [Neodidymelliopsis sp. IMI 364377]